jgi:tripartite-type tricarboxylate transporter receptor subunit TctC
MMEAGYPEVDADTWVGVIMPAGTDIRIIAFLHDEIVKLLGVAEVKERLVNLGYEPVGSSPAEYATQIRAEVAKWPKVIAAAGIKPQ